MFNIRYVPQLSPKNFEGTAGGREGTKEERMGEYDRRWVRVIPAFLSGQGV
jgi:hypothetical protein